MATTAERLKEIMRDRKLKQVDIIRMAEPYCQQYNLTLSKSDLSQFVHGKVTPGQWKISLLSKALNVNPAWLMGEDVPINPTEEAIKAKLEDPFQLTAEEKILILSYRAASPEYKNVVLEILQTHRMK